MKKLFFVLCCCALSIAGYAQQEVVTGIVTDATDGSPIPGVTVQSQASKVAVATDGNGYYTISAKQGDVLTFSFLGKEPQRITVQSEKIDVALKDGLRSLDEVIVIGYGTTRRRDLVGAVEQISGEVLAERPNINVSRSLQGMIPGLTVSVNDGKPSHNGGFEIRGAGSIGSGGGPLFLIDGVPGDVMNISPQDIASITVLKDASSAAIFGAEGAFGVILITTKKPEPGKTQINYNGRFSMHRRTVIPELVWNGKQWTDGWIKSMKESGRLTFSTINNLFKYNQEWYDELVKRDADPTLEKVRVNRSGEYEYFGNTNWLDVVYKDFNLSTEHNMSVSGGSDKATYYVSGRYFNQDGIYNAGNEEFTQYNFRARGSIELNKYLTLENNTGFEEETVHQPRPVDHQLILRNLQHQAFPMTMPKNPDGTWTEAGSFTIQGLEEGGTFHRALLKNLRSMTALTFKPSEQLTFKADFTYYDHRASRENVQNTYTFYKGPAITGTRPTYSLLQRTEANYRYQTFNATANYTPRLGHDDHFLSILAGWNMHHAYSNSVGVGRRGLIYPDKPTFGMMDGDYYEANQGGSEDAHAGFLYRVNYHFKKRYLLELSGRYDGNSKFPTNQQWGFFPSASLGWLASEEGFMGATKSWLDMLKIRLSAGSLGNGQVGAFSYMSNMGINRTGVLLDGSQQSFTSVPGNVAPLSLTWETSTTYDAGLDVDVLRNRLSFVFDVYRRNITEMYTIGPTLPAVYGADSPRGNNAEMKTIGWEVSLQWRDQFNIAGKPFSYHIKGMLWDSRSWITKFYNQNKNLGNYYEGQEIGEIWGYHIEGLFRDQADIDGHADQSIIWTEDKTNANKPGDLKFADLNDDGKVNSGANTVDDPGDRRVIGNSRPRYHFGINLGAEWNGIGISAFIQGVGQRHWYPQKESGFFWGQYDRPYGFMLQSHTGDNVWTEENQNFDAYWPRYRGYIANYGSRPMVLTNDRYLQNAAYVRLKSLQIDYSFNKKICNFLHISDLRVYLSGENLWTWSPMFKVTKNFDPEVINAGDSDFRATPGTDGDGYSYPMLATYTVGLNITF
ncbi:MAG: TonB-dependent receptor [Prevotellaceae bacterium]|jgi:TonB-linked SusC/RagA family outer membrane protein|nr:TonB-dependent receptor [Prevotellaceae bacterium]